MRNARNAGFSSTPRTRKPRRHPEDDIQRALFQWITLATPRIPQLALAFHPANGGERGRIEAMRLKGLGVRAGVPDVMIPGYNRFRGTDLERVGLAIELKAGDNEPTKEQLQWLSRLQSAGWATYVLYSFDDARAMIAGYFGVKP